MGTQVVQMDYAVVTDVSKGFSAASEMLKVVSKVLGVLVQVLRASAMAGAVWNFALAQYYDTIKEKCENLAKVCEEFAGDLARAVGDHKRGDIKGKSYFGEGV